MKRLGYPFYLATNAGAGISSPGQIDYKLADWLSTHHADSCLGTHLISPPLTQPRPQDALLGWAKWSIAKFFRASVWGYRSEDLSALKRSSKAATATAGRASPPGPGLTEPNTLSYALCDSPTGLLVIVMKGLRLLAPKREFTPTEIVNFTQLAWLPGPESAMRFWAYCQRHPEKAASARTRPAGKPRVALTVFLGGERAPSRGNNNNGSGNAPEPDPDVLEGARAAPYSCPAWAWTRYEVLYTSRASGDAGLLAWERPELIASGVRGLAAALLKADKRLKLSGQSEPQPPGQIVTSAETTAALEPEEEERPLSPALSDPRPGLLAPPKIGERLLPIREVSDDTKVASDDSLAIAKTPSPIPTAPSPVVSDPPPSASIEEK